MDSAVTCERVGHGASRSSTETNQRLNQANQPTAEHDGNNVPFPAKHSDKCDRAYDDGKPIDVSATRENDVQSKPESQIQNYTDDCGRDGRESRRQRLDPA